MPDETPKSPIIRGLTRSEVAEKTGYSEAVIKRIELRFQIRLCIALHKDPSTRHLVPRAYKKYITNQH